MTRKEYNKESQNIRSQVGGHGNVKSLLDDMEYYVDELEARIAELEDEVTSLSITHLQLSYLEAPKNCDGCKWYVEDDMCDYKHECARSVYDYYEPKGISDE